MYAEMDLECKVDKIMKKSHAVGSFDVNSTSYLWLTVSIIRMIVKNAYLPRRPP